MPNTLKVCTCQSAFITTGGLVWGYVAVSNLWDCPSTYVCSYKSFVNLARLINTLSLSLLVSAVGGFSPSDFSVAVCTIKFAFWVFRVNNCTCCYGNWWCHRCVPVSCSILVGVIFAVLLPKGSCTSTLSRLWAKMFGKILNNSRTTKSSLSSFIN